MTKEDIKLLLEAGLAGAQTHIDGDDGVHFAARVVFAGFAGLTPVKRHQLVYRALGTICGKPSTLCPSRPTPQKSGS